MPLFYNLDDLGEDMARVAGRLATIRQMMRNHPDGPARRVPNRNATDTLLLATWNLKEFGGGEGDKRTDESYWYIAEIVSHFDLIAIQEVGADLGAAFRGLPALLEGSISVRSCCNHGSNTANNCCCVKGLLR